MQTFRILIAGMKGQPSRLYEGVGATTPAYALKRVLDGGWQEGYKFASLGNKRLSLSIGETCAVRIERTA